MHRLKSYSQLAQLTEQNVRIAAISRVIPDLAPVRYEDGYMVHAIADLLVRDEMVTYERAETGIPGHYELRAMLGVIDPDYVKTMHERIAERQFARANELVGRAARAIEAFGPHDTVQKHVAISIIHDVLHDMQKTS